MSSPYVFPTQAELLKWIDTARAVYLEELGREIDPSGLATRLIEFAGGWHVEEVRADVRASDEWHAQHDRKARPTRSDVVNVRANFCGARDTQGRIVFDPYLIAGPDGWLEQKRAAGLTHVVMCPVANYPHYPLPSVDLRADPDAFAENVSRVLDAGLVPFIMLTTGDGGSAEDIDRYWPGLLHALEAEARYVILCPGFEVVGPGGGWTSAQLSKGLQTIKRLRPESVIAVHLQPERATGASHPVEADDPWQGDEAGFWTAHGGELVDLFAYQTPHGRKLLDGADWEDRWLEIVTRLGTGERGWRKVPLCFFESVAYDYYHGTASEADAARVRERAQALCQQHGIDCTWGNG